MINHPVFSYSRRSKQFLRYYIPIMELLEMFAQVFLWNPFLPSRVVAGAGAGAGQTEWCLFKQSASASSVRLWHIVILAARFVYMWWAGGLGSWLEILSGRPLTFSLRVMQVVAGTGIITLTTVVRSLGITGSPGSHPRSLLWRQTPGPDPGQGQDLSFSQPC